MLLENIIYYLTQRPFYKARHKILFVFKFRKNVSVDKHACIYLSGVESTWYDMFSLSLTNQETES